MEKKNNASRKAQRAARARKQRNRRIALTLCLLLVVCAASIGGTLAWLVDKTDSVTNTFTTAGIDIRLTETWNTDTNNDGENDAWTAQMIPGYSYTKDPKVTVSADSVDCYLFVKFEATGSPSKYLEYTSTLTVASNGWTRGTGTSTSEGGDGVPNNVWYRKVLASDTTRSWELLDGNTITVKDTVTKGNMPAAGSEPKLTYTAYASQLYKNATTEFTPAEAWVNVPKA